jgi:ethanolamine ammonia-lyase small subunit
MKMPARSRSLMDLRELTPARVGLGRAGVSMPTEALLDFTLAHARARDAVHACFDFSGMIAGLNDLGLEALNVCSRASERTDYLRRPDLGRILDQASQRLLVSHTTGVCPLAIVVGDGLSPPAVNAHAIQLVRSLIPRLAFDGIEINRAVVARAARVGLGDEIGEIFGARMMVMLIGERPGLSTPDSLGAYLTYAPKVGRTDAERNCVSNIHGAGLGYDEAAFKIAWLIREGLARELTGIALKDQSGERMPPAVTTRSS